MTDTKNLYCRIAAGAVFLAAAAWTVMYLARLPFNLTIGAVSVALAAIYLLCAWLLLRKHPGRLTESTPGFIFAGFLCGMTLLAPAGSTNTAAIAFKDWLGLSNLQFGLLSPIAEELLKFTTVYVLCAMIFRIRRPIEAVTVAIAVGIGFAAIENVTFILRGALDNLNSDLEGSLTSAGLRILPGPWAHALYTGLAAWGLGTYLCRTDRPLGWRIGQLIGWYVLGYAAHAFFNSAAELPGDVTSLIALLLTILLTWVGGIWLYLRSRKIGRRDSA